MGTGDRRGAYQAEMNERDPTTGAQRFRRPGPYVIDRRRILQLAAASAVAPASHARRARSRSSFRAVVRLIVPFAPAGGADVVAARRPTALRDVGPADGGREQQRRRRQHRGGVGGGGRTRRLPVYIARSATPSTSSCIPGSTTTRSRTSRRSRWCASIRTSWWCRCRRRSTRCRSSSSTRRRIPAGSPSRRLARHLGASRRRVVQAPGGHRADAHSLSRRRPGADIHGTSRAGWRSRPQHQKHTNLVGVGKHAWLVHYDPRASCAIQ